MDMLRSLTFSIVVFSVVAVTLSTACDPLPTGEEGGSGAYCSSALSQSAGAEIAPTSSTYQTSEIAQQFETSGAISINSVTLRLALENTTVPVDGNLTVSIEEDANGMPNNVPVMQEPLPTIDATRVTTDFNDYPFNFPEVQLQADTKYWVILAQQATNSNQIFWGAAYTTAPTNILGFNTYTNQWSNISSGINRALLFSFGCVQSQQNQ
jgi:hypothetical protein